MYRSTAATSYLTSRPILNHAGPRCSCLIRRRQATVTPSRSATCLSFIDGFSFSNVMCVPFARRRSSCRFHGWDLDVLLQLIFRKAQSARELPRLLWTGSQPPSFDSGNIPRCDLGDLRQPVLRPATFDSFDLHF